MNKIKPQHRTDEHQAAKRTGNGFAVASPQGQQIAQLQSMAESSLHAVEQAQVATMASYAPAYAAQRKLAGMVAESPRQSAQRQGITHAFGVLQAKTDVKENLDDATATKTSNKKINTPNYGEGWYRFAKDGYVIDSFSSNITDQTPKGTNPVTDTVDIAAKAEEMDGVQPGDIAGKNRPAHFKWGDAQKGIDASHRTGKWTWHHKKDTYKMELVDMHAHGGFFHYGGFSGWRDNEEDDDGSI